MINNFRLALDCNIFGLQRFGGISGYWFEIVRRVCNDKELTAHLILPKTVRYENFDATGLAGASVHRETLGPHISRYLRQTLRGEYSVFHTPYYRIPNRNCGRYVVTVHDFTYERYRSGLARYVHSKQKSESIYRADAIICVSESTRRDLIEFCPKIDTRRLHVVHLGVDPTKFYMDSNVVFSAYDYTVLFVGSRVSYKRFDLAVKAVSLSPNLILGIVGPALTVEEHIYLQRYLGSRWRVFGSISSNSLRGLYSSAFALICPSDYEGFGLPILEAMACGCPVIASSLSSFPEVGGAAAHYADDQSGECYAGMLEILQSTTVRKATIFAGIERSAKFDWEKTYQMTKRIYLDH
jgi:mannosyltransferase